MNLILAIVWFAVGVGVLLWEFVTGNRPVRLHILGDISPAWLGFPMCLYNLARWYSERAYRQDMKGIHETQDRRQYHFRHQREPDREIDPNFDFTSDPPPQPPPGDAPGGRPNITDQPPSMN